MGRLVAVLLFLVVTATSNPARLTIKVQVGPDQASLHTETATLSCDGNRVRGTGYLAEPARARRACRAVEQGRVQRVVRQQVSSRMCSMIYAGPQTARATGTIAGTRLDLRITRSDGCGVDDWNRLEPLLGLPQRGTTTTVPLG